VKVAALLSGILASAIALAASYFVTDLSVEFLRLWPDTISQQFLALVVWYGIVALPLVGGGLAVLSPISGGILLAAAAGVWVWLGTTFPTGFSPQLVVPPAFAAVGALAAFGASLRGLLRRRAERRQSAYSEAMEREDALRFEPGDDLARAVEIRSKPAERGGPPADAAADAIVPGVGDRRADGPPQGISGLVVVNALLLAILTIAVGILLYSDYRNGNLSQAFSTLPFEPIAQQDPGPAVAVGNTEDEQAGSDQLATLTASAAPPSLADIDRVAQAEVRVSSTPLDPAALPKNEWTDPFAYCAAVGTIDFPDHRYAGPMVTEAIASALRVPVSSPPDRVKWRCVDGAVLGCSGFRGPSCAPTPSVEEMLAFCAQNPGAVNLFAPNGTWSCNDTEPEIPSDQSWPVDARGFLPGAWFAIAPPAGSSAG
jgi:hypothetical protein